jgi:hypothetical protein
MTISIIHFSAIMIGSLDDGIRLVLISICLGACFIRAFWEIEQARDRRRRAIKAKQRAEDFDSANRGI